MEIRRIVDSEENHAHLSHILGGVLYRDSIVRSALRVHAKKFHDPWQRGSMNDWNIKKKRVSDLTFVLEMQCVFCEAELNF